MHAAQGAERGVRGMCLMSKPWPAWPITKADGTGITHVLLDLNHDVESPLPGPLDHIVDFLQTADAMQERYPLPVWYTRGSPYPCRVRGLRFSQAQQVIPNLTNSFTNLSHSIATGGDTEVENGEETGWIQDQLPSR